MKGQKRLEEIKKRLEAGIRNVNPENAGRYDIKYEPLENPHYVTPEQKAQGRYIWERSPNYQFLVFDKENPDVMYQVMTVRWPDISKPSPAGFSKEMAERYMGGSEFEPNLRKAIEALKKAKKEKRGRQDQGGLEQTTRGVTAILGVLGGLFFLSSNITGNAIANVSQNSSNILGVVLLVVGLVVGFFWVKKK